MEEFHSLPPTKGLARGCICGTLWLYTTFFRGISLKDFSKNNVMSDFQKIFRWAKLVPYLFSFTKNWLEEIDGEKLKVKWKVEGKWDFFFFWFFCYFFQVVSLIYGMNLVIKILSQENGRNGVLRYWKTLMELVENSLKNLN